MKVLLTPSLFLFLFFFAGRSSAQTLDLDSIPTDIKGKIKRSQAQLLSPPYTSKKLDQLVKTIHSLESAKQVSISLVSGKYQVKITLPPKIASIRWEGVENIDLTSLNNIFRIKEGESFQSNKLDEAAIRIKSWFVSQSFLHAEIEAEAIENSKKEIDIKLKVAKNKSFEINKIVINSESEILNNKLYEEISSFKGDEYSEENVITMRNTLRKYLLEKRYLLTKLSEPKININQDDFSADLFFQIDNTQQFEFSFYGNSFLSTSKILDSINWDEITTIGSDIGKQIKDKLTDFYKNNAFSNVSIKLTVLEKERKQTLRFEIEEGERTLILDWNLIGSYSRKQQFYIELLKDLSGPNTKRRHFVQTEIEDAVVNLNIALQNLGYLSSAIGIDHIEWAKDKKYVRIFLNIDEGPVTKLQSIEITGLKAFPKEYILKEIELKENAPLNLNKLESSLGKIKPIYLDNAYLDFSIKNENDQIIEYSKNNTLAKLKLDFSEGEKIEVKNIIVQGVSYTKVSVVTKSLAFKVGDFLTLEKIRESESNLQILGIFASIDIRPAPGVSAKRSILVNVRERDPGVFTLGLGFTDENKGTIKSFTGLIYKNIGGSAKVFQSRLEVQKRLENDSFLQNKLTLSYLEPFLFGQRLKGRTSLSLAQDIDFLNTSDTETIIKETKEIDFFLEKNINRHLKLGWKLWGISGTRRFEVDRKTDQDKLQVASIGPFVEIDYRDHPFTPRSGTYTLFNLEYASPNLGSSKDILFNRLTGAFNQYIPMNKTRSTVFAYSLRGGYVKNLGEAGALAIPQEKMFFLGGRSTVRGFDLSEIPYSEDIANLKPTENDPYYVSDSSTFGLVKLEIRFPLYGDLGAAFFYDGGLVDIPEVDIKDPYRDSIGFGLRYNTPVGPLSIEYGHKLNKKSYENAGRLHLSIGAF